MPTRFGGVHRISTRLRFIWRCARSLVVYLLVLYFCAVAKADTTLSVEPQRVSLVQSFDDAPARIKLAVTSTASAAQALTIRVDFTSSGLRRLQGTNLFNGSRLGGEHNITQLRRFRTAQPRRFLVGWRSLGGTSGEGLASARRMAAAEGAELQVFDNLGVAILKGGTHRTARRLKSTMPSVVDFIEWDQRVRLRQIYNTRVKKFWDPLVEEQWALRAIRHEEAVQMMSTNSHAYNEGSGEVVVAVIDSGIDISHPDFAGRLWTNSGEIPGNGIDDDGNGYIDDVHGWNFIDDTPDVSDVDGHGTSCAGIIAAAAGNGIGIVGVAANANVKIMVLKFVSNQGGLLTDSLEALAYAMKHKAKISSLSFGGAQRSTLYERALEAASQQDHLAVAAAGNEGRDADKHLEYPCAYRTGDVLCVAASDITGRLASFSNYGQSRVHLAAPGVDVLSTALHGRYAWASGTSMAVPHVAGAAALLQTAFPHLSSSHCRRLLLEATRVSGLAVLSGGALDLEAAARAAAAATWIRVLQAPPSVCCGKTEPIELEVGALSREHTLVEGVHTASVQLETFDGLKAEVTMTLTVHGVPELRLASSNLDFGRVAIGTSAAQELIITNVGSGTAAANVRIEADEEELFNVAMESLNPLRAGSSSMIEISCSPRKPGVMAGSAIIFYSVQDESGGERVVQVVALLRAEGAVPGELSLERWSGAALVGPPVNQLRASPAEWHGVLVTQESPLVAEVALPAPNARLGQTLACEDLSGKAGEGLRGHVALIERGTCLFIEKARNVERAGAVGILIFDTKNDRKPAYMAMPSDVDEATIPRIPAFHITRADGLVIRDSVRGGDAVRAELRLQPVVVQTAEDPLANWVQIEIPITNSGGTPLAYEATVRTDIFERSGDYDHYVGYSSDGMPLPVVWHSLDGSSEIKYFKGQDDAGVFLDFPGPVPFGGKVVSRAWLSVNGYLALDPDNVPSATFAPGFIGPEDAQTAIIAPYWDDLFCTTFCSVKAGTVWAQDSTVPDGRKWVIVIQYENIQVLAAAGQDVDTVSFQLFLKQDGGIEFVYHRWPSATSKLLVVGVEGFSGMGVALWDRANAHLPWTSGKPFSVRLLPWLLPQETAATSGNLEPGQKQMLKFRALTVTGDRQGWVTVAARDHHGTYSMTRQVRVVLQTAVRFAIRLPSSVRDSGVRCGETVTVSVVAETAAGVVAVTEERNVVLTYSNSSGLLGEITVPISLGEGNVTITSEVAGAWFLALREDLQTGLNISSTATLRWVAAEASQALLSVAAHQIVGIKFRVAATLWDRFGNSAEAPWQPGHAAPILFVRWQRDGTANLSGSLPLHPVADVVQHGVAHRWLEFVDPQEVSLWLEPTANRTWAAALNSISWGEPRRVLVLPHLFDYVPGPWADCSEFCGSASRGRSLTCQAKGAPSDLGDVGLPVPDCRGLVPPPTEEECGKECIRGDCLDPRVTGFGNTSDAGTRECHCLAGFSGPLCGDFEGCPSGMLPETAPDSGSSSPLPMCVGVQCKSIPLSPNLIIQLTNGGRYPSVASFSCPRGLALVSAGQWNCLRDGSWTKPSAAWCRGPDSVGGISCTLGIACSMFLQGRSLQGSSRVALIPDATECPQQAGQFELDRALVAEGRAETGSAASASQGLDELRFAWQAVADAALAQLTPARYAICWAESVEAMANAQFALLGSLTVTGPLPASVTCVLGMPCILEVRGVGLVADSDEVWIGSHGDRREGHCDGAVLTFYGWPSPYPKIKPAASVTKDAISLLWSVTDEEDGVAQCSGCLLGQVGHFASLCWRSSVGTTGVLVGQFAMQGPEQGVAFSCVLGTACAVRLDGLGLSLTDTVSLHNQSLQPPATACSGPSIITVGATALLKRAIRFEFGIFSDMQAASMDLCWARGGETQGLPVLVGTLAIIGPSEQPRTSCTLGIHCAVPLRGNGFDATNIVWPAVGKTCDDTAAAPEFEGAIQRQERITDGIAKLGTPMAGAGRTFAVCWGLSTAAGAPALLAGYVDVQGPRPVIAGPCSLGGVESCTLMLEGWGLQHDDKLELTLSPSCGRPSGSQRLGTAAITVAVMLPPDLLGVHVARDLHAAAARPALIAKGTQPQHLAIFDFGVPRTGYLSHPLTVCWRRGGVDVAQAVRVGTLSLVASATYLSSVVESAGRYMPVWIVSASCTLVAASRSHQIEMASVGGPKKLREALATLLGVNGDRVTVHAVGDNNSIGFKFSFASWTDSNTTAQAVLRNLHAIAGTGMSTAEFLQQLEAGIASVKFLTAHFEEPWLDFAVLKLNNDDKLEQRFSWWPSERYHRFLIGFFVALAPLVLGTSCILICPWYEICGCRLCHGSFSDHDARNTAAPVQTSSRSPQRNRGDRHTPDRPIVFGSPVRESPPFSTSAPSPGSLRRVGAGDQVEAVSNLLEMGFDYDSALAALERFEFNIDRAIAYLTAR